MNKFVVTRDVVAKKQRNVSKYAIKKQIMSQHEVTYTSTDSKKLPHWKGSVSQSTSVILAAITPILIAQIKRSIGITRFMDYLQSTKYVFAFSAIRLACIFNDCKPFTKCKSFIEKYFSQSERLLANKSSL